MDASQVYEAINVESNSRVHMGNMYTYYNMKDREESDSDSDSQDGMPEGWDVAQSQENDPYYVSPVNPDSGTGTTTWIKPMLDLAEAEISFREELEEIFREVLRPQSERVRDTDAHEPSPTSTGQDYYARVKACANDINAVRPSHAKIVTQPCARESRCSIFTEGSPIVIDEKRPSEAVKVILDELKKKKDSICIVENVNDDWIEALGAAPGLDIPCEFFAGQAISPAKQPIRRGTYIPLMDDIVERALPLGRRILRKKKEESVNRIINTLCEASVVVKTSVDNWILYGVGVRELDRVASCVAECRSILNRLKGLARSVGRSADEDNPKSNHISPRALHRQMADLEFLRLRRFFNLYATYEFDEHVSSCEELVRPTAAFFDRPMPSLTPAETKSGTDPSSGRYSLDTQISYIRVDKTMCLILVDPQPPIEYLAPNRPGRSRVNVRLPHACAGSGLVIPELLGASKLGLYESMKIFVQDAWHADVLCGEQKLPPTYEDYVTALEGNGNSAPSHSKLYTAMDPQAFLLMLSSALWERNLRYLETKLSILNIQRLRNANSMDEMVMINEMLYDCREDLGTLVSQVEHTRTHLPAYLTVYYENFPMIRHRHEATYMSPVGHLPEMLKRASKLDKLILDDFQILMSSVSVREGHESTRQTRLATGIAVLAFVYVPLTLVTGIFGMNIKGQDGFVWWAPILALVGVIALTVCLLILALLLFAVRRTLQKTGKAFSDVGLVALLLSILPNSRRGSRRAVIDEEAAISKDK